MEFLFELVLELILEGSIDASKSKKVPKPLRYVLIVFIVLFFAGIDSLFFITGFLAIKINTLLAILMFALGMIMVVATIFKFKELYISKRDNPELGKVVKK